MENQSFLVGEGSKPDMASYNIKRIVVNPFYCDENDGNLFCETITSYDEVASRDEEFVIPTSRGNDCNVFKCTEGDKQISNNSVRMSTAYPPRESGPNWNTSSHSYLKCHPISLSSVDFKTIRLRQCSVKLKRIDEDICLSKKSRDDNSDKILSVVGNKKDEWCVGLLVWAKLRGYPYWPAVIVKEQKSEEYFTINKSGSIKLHVMFLEYEKQTAWISESFVRLFFSANQFDEDEKLRNHFVPSKTLSAKFTQAVKTASSLLKKSLRQRLEYLA